MCAKERSKRARVLKQAMRGENTAGEEGTSLYLQITLGASITMDYRTLNVILCILAGKHYVVGDG